jgi:diadenosine tetraphosphate (Ap4A) HIT family hydrolase
VSDCVVCQKQRGEIEVPGGAIYEDALLFASHALIPAGKDQAYLGELLIEPKRHADGIEDLTEGEAAAIGTLARRLSRSLKTVTQAEHIYLFRLGHHVQHFHLWLIARYAGTPREFWGAKVDEWPDAPRGGATDIAALASRIRSELANIN